jgi:hypothetical protein
VATLRNATRLLGNALDFKNTSILFSHQMEECTGGYDDPADLDAGLAKKLMENRVTGEENFRKVCENK